jgi:alpha-N-acetylglucosamine transferase
MDSKVLLITIAIGENFLKEYNRLFRESQENYAKKHNYDFKVITDFIDSTYSHSNMSLFFQKTLVFSQEYSENYDLVIFIDSDILININSPPIHTYITDKSLVGIIDEYSQPTPEKRIQIQRMWGWETSATEYYKICNFDINTTHVFNSGVIACNPKIHGEFFKNIYNTHLPNSINHTRGPHYEQTSIGYELQRTQTYQILPNQFNAVWNITKLDNPYYNIQDYFNENYFMHFAGQTDFDKVESLQANNR